MSTADDALFGKVLPDTVAFGVSLGLAHFLKWELKDLAWSLWLSSLVVGHLMLLSAFVVGGYLSIRSSVPNNPGEQRRRCAVFVGIAAATVLFAFISLVVCAFHVAHASFLNARLPIDGMPARFFEAAESPPLIWISVFRLFRHLLWPYGLFLILAIIAERHYVFRPLVELIAYAQTIEGLSDLEQMRRAAAGLGAPDIAEVLDGPFIKIARMNLMIGWLAFCNAMNIDSLVMYVATSFVYFCPWRVLWGGTSKGVEEIKGDSRIY